MQNWFKCQHTQSIDEVLRSKKSAETLQEQKEHEKQNTLQTETFERSETVSTAAFEKQRESAERIFSSESLRSH